MHLRHRLLKHRRLKVQSNAALHASKESYVPVYRQVQELRRKVSTVVKYKVKTIDELEDGSRIQEMRLVLVQDQLSMVDEERGLELESVG